MRSIYNVLCRSKSNTEIINSICCNNAQVNNSFDVKPNLVNPSTVSKKAVHAKNGSSNAKASSPTHLVDGVRMVKKLRLSKVFTIPEIITVWCMPCWNLTPRGPNLINSPGITAHMMMSHEMNNHLNSLVLIIFLLWLTIVREMFHMLLMQCWVIWLTLLLLIQASMIPSCTTSVFKWDSRPYHSIERNNSL